MINYTLENLPDGAEKELRQWLARPALQTLIKIAESDQKYFACLALQDAEKANPDNMKLDAANANLATAQDVAKFIMRLREYNAPEKPFKIIKLT